MTQAQKLIGTVDKFNEAPGKGGFGFIVTDSRERYFFHRNEVPGRRRLPKGSLVRFTRLAIETKGKCDRAIDIEIINIPDPVPA